uniref:Cadherin domain-containing protein n=1 Tax=Junco hyemalis TaxID=40217 RepID=A0A8C5J6A8_JUNHY
MDCPCCPFQRDSWSVPAPPGNAHRRKFWFKSSLWLSFIPFIPLAEEEPHIPTVEQKSLIPFQPSSYQATVEENRPAGTPVTQVTAQDPDEGEAGQLQYSMAALFDSRSDDLFTVDPVTGAISTAAPLDRESKSTHVFRVTAVDHGIPRRSAMATLTVTVSDTNDHDPAFEQPEYRESVRENLEVGYEVLTVRATDGDAGPNANVLYRLLNAGDASEVFEIDSRSGVIRTRGPVDREVVDAFELLVEATDQGQDPGPRSATATVRIAVEDDNDNAPQFSERRYVAQVPEDVVPNVAILQVMATDRDKGSNALVHYSIVSGNTRGHFYIDAQTGTLDVVTPLDYERQYLLTIAASDGTRQDTAQVVVNVTDANTHRPVFQSSHYTININEDRPVGTTVVVISATDEDTGENARITYLMEDSIPQFSIAADTGAVTTQMELDYEDQVSYTLAITARDNGIPQKSDTTYLEILVSDVNDNAPQFLRHSYQGSIYEDVPTFTSVLQVSATDRDSGLNGRVFYTFQGGDDGDGDFIIESTSGIVRTLRRLDRENVPLYLLQAFAVDKGVPARRTPVEIQVTVLDVNDNPPVFEQDEFDIFVEENSPIGLVVARITRKGRGLVRIPPPLAAQSRRARPGFRLACSL